MPKFSLGGLFQQTKDGGLVLPQFDVPVSNPSLPVLKALLGEAFDKLLDLSGKAANGIIWRFPFKTSEDPTALELIVFDYDDLVANTTANINLDASYTARGVITALMAFNASTHASLGHLFADIVPGGTKYFSTTNTEAASGGTTKPAFGLNATEQLVVTASTTVDTRIAGLLVVFYA